MGCHDLDHRGNFTFLRVLIVAALLSYCHGNKIGYKHLQVGTDDILVDQIIPLEEEVVNTEDTEEQTDEDTTDVSDEVTKDEVIENLSKVVNHLKRELRKIQRSQNMDREAMIAMEKRMMKYHEETIISNAEVVQIRQLVSENFDEIQKLKEDSKDLSVYMEGYQIFQRDATRDLRRLRDYKERAARRFHQLENHVERLHKHDHVVDQKFNNLTQEIQNLTNGQIQLRNLTFIIHEIANKSINFTSTCCMSNRHNLSGDSEADQADDPRSTKQYEGYPGKQTEFRASKIIKKEASNEVEITNFGSGETSDDYLSSYEEETNRLTWNAQTSDISNNELETGSGQAIFSNIEGSGDLGSGVVDELIPVMDVSRFMEVKAFKREIMSRDETIQELIENNQNLTAKLSMLEDKLASIQLGSYVQTLQDSFINFTQNVITLDQWKVSSTQMVNSTLNNQDQIFKLTNMILENADKLKDLKWKLSNAELLGDQQFRILRMHVVRINNTVEDIREELLRQEKRDKQDNQYASTYYGYQTSYYPGSHSTSNNIDDNQSTSPHSVESLLSKLDELGIQVLYNQNRLGNLEIKLLNESLYQCRKQNLDTYQDSQITELETTLQSTIHSMTLTQSYVRNVAKTLHEIEESIKGTQRKVRTNSASVQTMKKLIPIVVGIRKEVQNFLFQLPSDCQEYYERGYRKSGIYVIHPIRATKSSQVTCVFDQSGGWTVLQQRFSGIQDFKRNWTDYREGFGNVKSEYWVGNDIIYLLTSNKNYSLRIDMVDKLGNHWQANYNVFQVSLPRENSKLSVSGFHGNVSDSLSYSNDMGFSTADNDNDASSTNCGYFYEAGWWYKHCQMCNLNGRYDIGFLWFNMETNDWIQLTSSTMKILPT